MKVVIVNGSPRKNFSTGKMLDSFAEGIKSVSDEIEIERVNLYSLNYHGCISCFGCKRIGSPKYGHCIVKDGLQPVLESIENADGLAIGMPNYFSAISSGSSAFFERLCFPRLEYTSTYSVVNRLDIPIQTFYSMNGDDRNGYFVPEMDRVDGTIEHIGTRPERIVACDTYQFNDYSKYVSTCFDEAEKRYVRDNIFPQTLKSAFDAGAKMAQTIIKTK